MPTPLARVVAHWPLKLASLALAVLLWALVSAEQVTTHWIPVTVEAEVRDPRYVLTGGPGPAEVRVLFAGPGRILWQLALNRPSLVLPVREPEGGGYALGPEMIRFPEGVRGVVVRDIRPAVVRLDMERIATREVPVRARFSPSPDDRWVVRGTPEVSPGTVVCGTGRSSTSNSGSPVSRCSRKSDPILVACATAGTNSPSRITSTSAGCAARS